MGSYTTKTKSNRWTHTAFYYLLDTVRVNASTVFSLANKIDPKKTDSFEFGSNLAYQLIMPFLQKRPVNGIQTAVQINH